LEKIGRLNALIEAVKSSPNRIHKIFIQKNAKKRKIQEIIKLARINHAPFLFVPKRKLEDITHHNKFP